jgi:hypothetical protein
MTAEDIERISKLYDMIGALGFVGFPEPTPGDAAWQAAIYIVQEAIKSPGLGPNGEGYLFGWWNETPLWPFSKELQVDLRAIKTSDPALIAGGLAPLKRKPVQMAARVSEMGALLSREKQIDYEGSTLSVPSDLYATWLAKTHFLVAKRGQPWWDVVDSIALEHMDDPLWTPGQIEAAIVMAVKELTFRNILESDRQWLLEKPKGGK